MNHGYGCQKDSIDNRDFKFGEKLQQQVTRHKKIDLRINYPYVFNQMTLGGCTAFASGTLAHYLMLQENKNKAVIPAHLALYFWTRILENTVSWDSGASVRNAVKTIHKYGTPNNQLFPYDPKKYLIAPQKPVQDDAKLRVFNAYYRLNQTLDELKTCLSMGYPFVFGFSVYDSFESESVANTGIVPIPQPNETFLGGHAVICLGYEEDTQRFICRNSWSSNWGDKGDFYLPYAYITNKNLASDFWTAHFITLIDPPKPPQPKKKKIKAQSRIRGRKKVKIQFRLKV